MSGIGHGKVILLGEHGVVYGCPALAAALPRGASAEAQAAPQAELRVEPWGVALSPNADSEDSLARALAALLATYPQAPKVSVHARVELPAAAGLGCSAALGVAVARAIDEHLGLDRADEALLEASLAWERVFHGNPSGVDSAMAVHGGVGAFRRGHPLEPLRLSEPLHLVVAHTGEASSTADMVGSVRRQYDSAPTRVAKVFEAMKVLVDNARPALEAGDHQAVGQLFDLNQQLLAGLMLSTSKLEELCRIAREAGAAGAKLTGAGGGGCMIALAADAVCAERVSQALRPRAQESFVVEVRS